MSTKFHRAKKAQPLPKVCTKPPIPRPPDAPIEHLRAYGRLTGYNPDGDYLDIPIDAVITHNPGTPPQTYSGSIRANCDTVYIKTCYYPPQQTNRTKLTLIQHGASQLQARWYAALPDLTHPAPPWLPNPDYYPYEFSAQLRLIL